MIIDLGLFLLDEVNIMVINLKGINAIDCFDHTNWGKNYIHWLYSISFISKLKKGNCFMTRLEKQPFAWLWAAVQGSETHKVNLCRIFIIALHESVHFRNKSDLKHNWVPLKKKYFYTFSLLRGDASTLYVK